MSDIAIRDGRVEADHDELFALYALVVEEGGAFPREPPADEDDFREAWIDGKTGVYVARSAGALAGSYHLLPNFDGRAAHIANAGYMVAPRLPPPRGSAARSSSTRSPRRRGSASTR